MQEHEKRLSLTSAIQAMQNVEKDLLSLDEREVEARRQFAGLGATERGTTINSSSFWVLDQFIWGQKFRRVDLKTKLQQKEDQVSYAYKEFLHARQQKKIIEKLRERKEEEYDEETRRQEKNNTDNLYTMRHRLTHKGEDDNE